MKALIKTSFLFITLIAISSCSSNKMKNGKWDIVFNPKNNSLTVRVNDSLLSENLYASYRLGERLITTKDYSDADVNVTKVNDKFGTGHKMTISYSGGTLPTLIQSLYIYDDKEYLLTQLEIYGGQKEIAVNYMVPVNIDNLNTVINGPEARALFIPFDNDCWVRYKSHKLDFDILRSYEVSALFNDNDRRGLIVGSIEHTDWKSGIEWTGWKNNQTGGLKCIAGVADKLTRDSRPHGFLKGTQIKSPLIFISFTEDWRDGMEEYGKANAIVTPKKEWNKAMPMGWNSWGALQFNLTYQKALEVSDYFKQELMDKSFINSDNTIVIGLDSGWNSFSEEELKDFVEHCKKNGQMTGVYWTPFTDWGKRPDEQIQEAPQYKFKDTYVYANGKPQELDGAYAVDPTHPATEMRMKQTSELFRRCGFDYVKMDFMTHGMMEGDSWYNKEIQTGAQAYNYGMKLIEQYFGDMYINLSISPIFPANYANSRRIACDAWNKIKDTEYSLNALSYGWWIDEVYQYNDADHIVLRDATEGENRARVTSSIITGLYVTGDDFSVAGDTVVKRRALNYLTHPEINKLVSGDSFRPVNGTSAESENQFVKQIGSEVYFAIFNYGEEDLVTNIAWKRVLGKEGKPKQAIELWRNQQIDLNKEITIPAKDVYFLRLTIN